MTHDTAAAVDHAAALAAKIAAKSARMAILGLGYVGLPLALTACEAGYEVVGFDIDEAKPPQIAAGRSYLKHIDGSRIAAAVASRRLIATSDTEALRLCDVFIICVPTPLTRTFDPDLSYVERTVDLVGAVARPGALVVLESTTYPGTTREVVLPRLRNAGFESGSTVFIAFSPEREDPGNPQFQTRGIPKLVGGDGHEAQRLTAMLYGGFVDRVVPVSSPEVAEAAKLTENIFRAVNIALVNELKIVFEAMGIDVWEVIDAAATKPFGFMPFWPGPGLGGHCIPIDPFYLAWKAREFEVRTRFIELAGEVNIAMPHRVVERLAEALDRKSGLALSRSRVLVLGLAYKKNVDDIRESPSLKLIELLMDRSAVIDYHDPFVREVPATRAYGHLMGKRSVDLSAPSLETYDAVLIATDHDHVDYGLVVAHSPLIVDTRNVIRRKGLPDAKVVRA